MSTGRRWTARFLDWLVVGLLSSPLWILTFQYLKHEAIREGAGLARTGIVMLVLGQWTGIGAAATEALGGFWDTVVLFAAATLAAQILVVAMYDLACHAWFGQTLGKTALSLRVVRRDVADGTATGRKRRLRAGQAVGRTALTVLLPGLAWVTVLAALLHLSVLLGVLGTALLVTSVVECVMLRTTGGTRTCWHDRVCRTAVVPKTWNAEIQQVKRLGRRAYEGSRTVARRTWESAPTQRALGRTRAALQQARNHPGPPALEGGPRRAFDATPPPEPYRQPDPNQHRHPEGPLRPSDRWP